MMMTSESPIFRLVSSLAVLLTIGLCLRGIDGSALRQPLGETVVEYVYEVPLPSQEASLGHINVRQAGIPYLDDGLGAPADPEIVNNGDNARYQQEELIFSPGSDDELRVRPDGTAVFTQDAVADYQAEGQHGRHRKHEIEEERPAILIQAPANNAMAEVAASNVVTNPTTTTTTATPPTTTTVASTTIKQDNGTAEEQSKKNSQEGETKPDQSKNGKRNNTPTEFVPHDVYEPRVPESEKTGSGRSVREIPPTSTPISDVTLASTGTSTVAPKSSNSQTNGGGKTVEEKLPGEKEQKSQPETTPPPNVATTGAVPKKDQVNPTASAASGSSAALTISGPELASSSSVSVPLVALVPEEVLNIEPVEETKTQEIKREVKAPGIQVVSTPKPVVQQKTTTASPVSASTTTTTTEAVVDTTTTAKPTVVPRSVIASEITVVESSINGDISPATNQQMEGNTAPISSLMTEKSIEEASTIALPVKPAETAKETKLETTAPGSNAVKLVEAINKPEMPTSFALKIVEENNGLERRAPGNSMETESDTGAIESKRQDPSKSVLVVPAKQVVDTVKVEESEKATQGNSVGTNKEIEAPTTTSPRVEAVAKKAENQIGNDVVKETMAPGSSVVASDGIPGDGPKSKVSPADSKQLESEEEEDESSAPGTSVGESTAKKILLGKQANIEEDEDEEDENDSAPGNSVDSEYESEEETPTSKPVKRAEKKEEVAVLVRSVPERATTTSPVLKVEKSTTFKPAVNSSDPTKKGKNGPDEAGGEEGVEEGEEQSKGYTVEDEEENKTDAPAEFGLFYHGKHSVKGHGRRRRRDSSSDDYFADMLAAARQFEGSGFQEPSSRRLKRSATAAGMTGVKQLIVDGHKVYVNIPETISPDEEESGPRKTRQTVQELVSVSAPRTSKFPPAFCELDRDSGILCPGVRRGIFLEQFYYDADNNRCSHFVYNGCGGNANRFSTLWECTQYCGKRHFNPNFN